ncbi:MAG: nitroreductase family protein [Victivallaceae bacterium]|jgi:nitroreductase
MNSKLDFIFNRRSVRKFTAEAVSEENITELLESAMAAPSACAKDPWRFIVIKNRENLRQIAELLPNGKFLAQAPAGIVVCGDINAAHAESESYMLQDCSAAIENILLASVALGLGTCWLGVHPRPERIAGIAKFFELPANIVPVSVIAIGHPEKMPDKHTRFMANNIHWEKW